FVCDRGFLLRELERREELRGLLDRERRHLVDRLTGHPDVARLLPQTRTSALGTGQVSPIPAQENADVNLVLLSLEPPEEPADPGVADFRIRAAADDEFLLGLRQLRPGHVDPHVALARGLLQLRELGAVMRLAPRLDRALLNRLGRVRHDEVDVELDDVAEAVATGTRAERVVEREQPRLRVFVRDAARPALETLGEFVDSGRWP